MVCRRAVTLPAASVEAVRFSATPLAEWLGLLG